DLEEEIKALGFVFNVFGENSIVVNGIPADVRSGEEKGLFEGLIEQYKLNKDDIKLDNKENLARSLAKRSSIKAGRKLAPEEMSTLVDQLFACDNPNFGPSGNMTFVLLDLESIEGFFKK
ncbi:MAG: DNA mismatch repair protein MutL, partial [Saprospiraceae bacterium]|nr:DNA mismatch repair protein MutL [Saprospiraceae bacterium]